jgi:hypothetical protein
MFKPKNWPAKGLVGGSSGKTILYVAVPIDEANANTALFMLIAEGIVPLIARLTPVTPYAIKASKKSTYTTSSIIHTLAIVPV